MANFEGFHWNFLLSTNPEIGRSEYYIHNYLPAFLESFSTGLGKLSGRAPTESTLSSDNGSPARSGVLQIIRVIIYNSSNNIIEN